MDVRVRAAVLDDATALGRVMVEAWLAAHYGQVPEVAWQRRVEEWTPEASASGWARLLAEHPPRTFLLVAEDRRTTCSAWSSLTGRMNPARRPR